MDIYLAARRWSWWDTSCDRSAALKIHPYHIIMKGSWTAAQTYATIITESQLINKRSSIKLDQLQDARGTLLTFCTYESRVTGIRQSSGALIDCRYHRTT